MSKTKYLKGECQHCGGRLEYPAEAIGTVAECPHCQQQTELLLARPPEEPTVPRRIIVWTVITVLILGLGLAGAVVALKRAQRLAARQKQQAASVGATNDSLAQPTTEETGGPWLQKGFSTSAVTLEKAQGSSLVYAVGNVKNTTNRQRFGVKIELELFDGSGAKLGTASDYRPVLEAGGEWNFKALVVDSKAASAKILSIKEDQ